MVWFVYTNGESTYMYMYITMNMHTYANILSQNKENE